MSDEKLEKLIEEFVKTATTQAAKADTRLALLEQSFEFFREDMKTVIRNAVLAGNEDCRKMRRRQVRRALAKKADIKEEKAEEDRPKHLPAKILGGLGMMLAGAMAYFFGGK